NLWFFRRRLKPFPLGARDAGFLENDRQQVAADVAAVGIGNRKLERAFPHDLVRPCGGGTEEAGAAKGADQVTPLDRAEARHQAALLAGCLRVGFFPALGEVRLIPSMTG